MASLGSWLLDLFYPPRCMICHRLLRSGEREICPGCLQSLPDYDGPEPQVRFAEHCAVTFYYEGRLRESFPALQVLGPAPVRGALRELDGRERSGTSWRDPTSFSPGCP
jgi:predicted amidophosphoribosyltransferase